MRFRAGNNRNNRLVQFNSILPGMIDELNLTDSFLIESIRAMWDGLAGDIISTHSIPDRIFHNILYISVDHSVYANELVMMKDMILERIESELSIKIIKNIKIELKKLNWNVKRQ